MAIDTRAFAPAEIRSSGNLEPHRRTPGARARRLCPAIAAVLLPAALLSGCGSTLVVRPSGAEHVITTLVQQKTGVTPIDVHCPSGVTAKVGTTFDCSFKAPNGTKYTAHMKINYIKGTTVGYHIRATLG
jgi:hypothetical protein